MRCIFLAAIILGLGAGCSRPINPLIPQSRVSDRVIDETRAIEIAKQAAAENDNWYGDCEVTVERDGEGWSVFLIFVKYDKNGDWSSAAGHHAIVLIDKYGTVTEYLEGA